MSNAVERALILSGGKPLTFEGILEQADRTGERRAPAAQPVVAALADAEAAHIRMAMEITGGRVEGEKGAAAILRMNPGTLRHRMRKLGIPFGRAGKGDGGAVPR